MILGLFHHHCALHEPSIKLILKYIALFHTLHENEIELALFTNELLKLL